MAATPITAYLALGSNVGDRLENLRRACAALESRGIRLRRASSIYETEPVDFLEQGWFLNGVIEVETTLEPARLLDALQQIEREMGRERLRPNGPRTLDLDILLYKDCVIREEGLVVPHPRLNERRLVLEPLREIAPFLELPLLRRTAEQLCRELRDSSQVRRICGPLLLPANH